MEENFIKTQRTKYFTLTGSRSKARAYDDPKMLQFRTSLIHRIGKS
jgi:hypothetical protein